MSDPPPYRKTDSGKLYIDITGMKNETLYYCLDDYPLEVIIDARYFEGYFSIKFIDEEIFQKNILDGGRSYTIPRLEPFLKVEIP